MLDRTNEPWPLEDFTSVFWKRQRRLFHLRALDVPEEGEWRPVTKGQDVSDRLVSRGKYLVPRYEIRNERLAAACIYYKTRPFQFIKHWGVVLEPREAGGDEEKITLLPFLPFKKQRELIQFLHGLLLDKEDGLIEKSRDMGATWTCVWISIWLWLFWPGAVIGWGSKGQDEVDQINNPNSILEKIRIGIRNIPPEFLPDGFNVKAHMPFMRITNPETSAAIIGDVGDNIGRGGRSLIYFKDESAHYLHPDLVEAALSENTQIQVDLSSVRGTGTVFHRRREAGQDWYPGAEMEKGRVRVFVMDWREHPGKTQEWYDRRRKKYEDEGLLHIFAQEVDRDYAAAVEGVIIPALWVKAAIDAHLKLQPYPGSMPASKMFDLSAGMWAAALDVADEGGDTNAMSLRKGILVTECTEWGARDPGVTTRNVIAGVREICPIEIQYDCIGLGVAVKSEVNRIEKDEKKLPKGIVLTPWDAGAEVANPESHVIPNDKKTPLNKDFFENYKAQAWWMLARRFHTTYRAINEPGFTWKPEDIISISSKIPLLRKLEKELSQPVFKQSGHLKLMVDKKPKGSKSPNMADSIVMNFWPVRTGRPLIISSDVLARAGVPSGASGSIMRTRMRAARG